MKALIVARKPRPEARAGRWRSGSVAVALAGARPDEGEAFGVLIIVLNYLGLLPGEASNGYLFLGLGFITAGFLLATQYR